MPTVSSKIIVILLMVMSSLMFDGLKSVDRVQSEKRLARCLSGTNRDVFFPVRKSCFVFKMKLIHFVGRRIPKKWLNIGDIYLYYPPKSGLWIGCGRLTISLLSSFAYFGIPCVTTCIGEQKTVVSIISQDNLIITRRIFM